MGRITRRWLLYLAGAGALGVVGVRFGLPVILRSFGSGKLSARATAFVDRCFEGIDRKLVWDTHVHLIGLGVGGSGCEISPKMLDHLHPVKRFQFELYKAGAGITRDRTADPDYVARMLELTRGANPQGKLLLMAFDRYVDEDGVERPALSPIYTPNEYALQLASRHDEFEACASIHPYREDAVERLDRVVDGGARAIKWLPNAMGIDPASPRCDPFYRRMAEMGLPLISHAGKELAVDSAHHQEWGHPLRLRRALDAGVTVVTAHCAALGRFADTEADEAERKSMSSFDLFMRMFTERQYEGTLFADISAMAHIHHASGPLRRLLMAPELHDRLLYATDYPLPALRFMVSPLKLQLDGLLDASDSRLCEELFDYNPMLFNFAVCRALRVERGGRRHSFSPGLFHTARLFGDVNRPRKPSSSSA